MYSVAQLAMDCFFFQCHTHPIRVESILVIVRILPIGASYALIMTVVIDTKYGKLCTVFRMSEVGLG